MADKIYQVTAPMIMAKVVGLAGVHQLQGYYEGQFLPPNATQETIEHHLGTKQIEEVRPEDAPAPAEETDPGEGGKAADTDTDADKDGNPDVKAGDQIDMPAKNAKRGKWIDFAVSKGGDRADMLAKNVTRDDLITVYGTKN